MGRDEYGRRPQGRCWPLARLARVFTAHIALACTFVAGACGWESTSLQPPARLGDLSARPTSDGVAVSFVLYDQADRPTTMMWATGVIRIEDRGVPADTCVGNALDTSRTLYNRQLILSREHFVKQAGTEGGRKTPVCELGRFPYRHFERAPVGRQGLVRIVVVRPPDSLLVDSVTVTWPADVYANREQFGSVRPFGGGG